jgi:hypothetical protein
MTAGVLGLLLGVAVTPTGMLIFGLRTRSRRARGLLPRWTPPRPPRRNFASWREVRSRLNGAARPPTIVVDSDPEAGERGR